eukprot:bmy_06545T0
MDEAHGLGQQARGIARGVKGRAVGADGLRAQEGSRVKSAVGVQRRGRRCHGYTFACLYRSCVNSRAVTWPAALQMFIPGALYYEWMRRSSPAGSNTRGRKLPFTIPELVQASPCRSSDGILYMGKKQDIWYVVDLLTGEKQQTLSSAFADSLCPSTSLLYLGRTEYTITMYDTKTRELRWNATYFDYAAALPEDDGEYSSGLPMDS